MRILVYVIGGNGHVETYTLEGREAEELLERLRELEKHGLARRGRLPPAAMRL